MIKLYIDDKRPAPEGWILVKTAKDAVNFIEENYANISHISFDGYLSDTMPHTGKDVIQNLKYFCKYENINIFHQSRENYTCHSADSRMNEEMNLMIDNIFGISSGKEIKTNQQKKSLLSKMRNSKGRR